MRDVPEECYEREHDWGEPEDLGNDVWRVTCKLCRDEVEEVLIVKYWKHKTITVRFASNGDFSQGPTFCRISD